MKKLLTTVSITTITLTAIKVAMRAKNKPRSYSNARSKALVSSKSMNIFNSDASGFGSQILIRD